MAEKRKGRFWRVAGIAAVAVAVVLAVVVLRLGAVVRTAVNTLGPQILGVPVSVESVKVQPFRGKFDLRMLTIGNPEGYTSEYLFRLENMRLDISMGALLKGQTHIREIIIEGPSVWFDRKLTRSNIGDLLEKLESEEAAEVEEPGKEPGKTVLIDLLQVRDGTVGIKMGVGMKLPLPGIELRDIGREKAMMPVQIIRLVLVNIFKGVINVVAGAGELAVEGVKAAGGLAVEGVKGAGGLAVEGVKGAGGLAVEGVKSAGEAVGGVVSGIGGLFKGGSGETAEASAKDGETPPADTGEK